MPALFSFVFAYCLANCDVTVDNGRARLCDADSRRQAAVDVHPVVAAIGTNVLVPASKKVDSVRAERRDLLPENRGDPRIVRRDADDGMRDAIQGQRLPNDVGIGTEPVLPERVRQNHDRLNL